MFYCIKHVFAARFFYVWILIGFLSYRLVFGTLYPAYSSYKAVKSKDVKEYVSKMFLALQ